MTKGQNLSRLVGQHLQSLRRAGVTVVPHATGRDWVGLAVESPVSDQESVESVAPPATTVVRESSVPLTPLPRPEPATVSPGSSTPERFASPRKTTGNGGRAGDRAAALDVIASEVEQCTRCEELVRCRNRTVFGVGNPDARLVLVGEGPGEREDQLGEPFVGPAGELLDKILAACGLDRQKDVYILNAVKCRPPRNRNPKPEELEQCWGYAERQLEILQPEFICCLGSVAARTLLKTSQSVGRLRKQFHDYRGSRVMVTYHPAYLLRTSSAKKHAWDDMQMLMAAMGIPIPATS